MTGVDHLGFIVAAYGVTAVSLVATVAAMVMDSRAQKRLLARFAPGERERP